MSENCVTSEGHLFDRNYMEEEEGGLSGRCLLRERDQTVRKASGTDPPNE